MSATTRRAAVAGRFYPRDRETLLTDVRSYLKLEDQPEEKRVSALGCIVPHAGYIYSGQVAGAVYAGIKIPQQCVILCPNHTGMEPPLSIMSTGSWETPLGMVPVDTSLAEKLKRRFPFLTEDAEAHRAEHAVEVHLPFLQILRPDLSFVPIVVGTSEFEVLESLGAVLAETLADAQPALIIASSDMNHYENDTVTRKKDHKAIERILALEPRGLFDVVIKEKISMCGFGPAVAMLTAAKCLDAHSAELVQYATSGDVSGDRRLVVGYAGVVVR